jgi:hypothetical protein
MENKITHVVLSEQVINVLNLANMNPEESDKKYGIVRNCFYKWEKAPNGSDYSTWLFTVLNPNRLTTATIKYGITFIKVYKDNFC